MLGLRSALKYILPELPEWLAAEIARAEHCRREMQCKGPSPRATPPSPPSSTSMSHEQSTPDMFDKTEHITRWVESQGFEEELEYNLTQIPRPRNVYFPTTD